MAWIESHQTLVRHPKTRKAARMLGIGIPQMIGHLHCLWYWAFDYAQDGNLTPYENADIADAALWQGDPNAFVQALIECGTGGAGFIDEDYQIHEWMDYAGKLILKRKADAVRKRAVRLKLDSESPSTGHPPDIRGTAQVPNRTQPNHTGPNPTGGERAKNRAATPTPLSSTFEILPLMREWGAEKVPMLDLDSATEQWLDYCRSKNVKYIDWQAAWRQGMRKADQWARENAGKVGKNGMRTRSLTEAFGAIYEEHATGIRQNGITQNDNNQLLSIDRPRPAHRE